jgi:flagellar motility protein MotE (MotC chaperone)
MQYPSSPFRILPITIAACCFMMVVKTAALLQGEEQWQEVLAPSAIAEDAKPAEEKADKKEEVKAEKKKSDNADKKADKIEVAPKPEELAEKCQFNQIEVDLLQSLSARRKEIEKWADDVKIQANVLKATEMQIDQKIAQMQKLQTDVQEILKKYDAKEKVELKSLVKIYENMKPKDAARIFDEMEMNILLDLVDMMSERKAAPILAGMNPLKAKNLTIELAEKRQLRQEATAAIDAETGKGEAEPAPPLN